MTQVSLLSGIYTSSSSGLDYRVKYPRNMYPIATETGISKAYIKAADGLVQFNTNASPGVDRGAINWNGVLIRVMGSKLVSVDSTGNITVLGDVGGTTANVSMDYGFDRLAIASNGHLYYWDGTNLTLVTDPNAGTVNDVIWIDGYYCVTDGNTIAVSTLANPTVFNPLSYGSAESDPDPIKGLFKVRNELYAIGRYTIEVFQNVGGAFFPFQRINGAIIQRGAIGVKCFCLFDDNICFVGGMRNESLSIWAGANGVSTKLATREIDLMLQSYTQAALANVVMEKRIDNGESTLYVQLPDRTLVYDSLASHTLGSPVWYTLDSGTTDTPTQLRARHLVRIYDKWIVGDPTSTLLGIFTRSIGSHYGTDVQCEINTVCMYNASRRFVVHELELIGITGRVTGNPSIYLSSSADGVNFTAERARSAGSSGNFKARVNWLQLGMFLNWAVFKFRWKTDAHISMAALEMRGEPCQ